MADHGIEAKADTDVKVDIYNYDNLSEEGKSIVIAFRDGNLYNEDETVAAAIEGGHAMVVTGVTSDGCQGSIPAIFNRTILPETFG